ncbi:hypothetical protein FRB95_012226 [Tulasnella sp. JGI-2019a]|nr:hypothetical protein FRB95_012226 [Tulasnella sp. JGI-2019a]
MTRQSPSSTGTSTITDSTTATNNITQRNDRHPSLTTGRRGSFTTNESRISNTNTTAIVTTAVNPSLPSHTRERIFSGGDGISRPFSVGSIRTDKGGVASGAKIDTLGYGEAKLYLNTTKTDMPAVVPDYQRRRQRIVTDSNSSSAPKIREKQRAGSLDHHNFRPLIIRQHVSASAIRDAATTGSAVSGSETMHHSYLRFHSGNANVDNDRGSSSETTASATAARRRTSRIHSQPQKPSPSASDMSSQPNQRSVSDAGIHRLDEKGKDVDHADDISAVIIKTVVKKRVSELPPAKPKSMLYTSVAPQPALTTVPRGPLPTLKADRADSDKAHSLTVSRRTTSSKTSTSRMSLQVHGSNPGQRYSTGAIPLSSFIPPLERTLETLPQSAMEQSTTSPLQTIPQGPEFKDYTFPIPLATSSLKREEAKVVIGTSGESSAVGDNPDIVKTAKAIGDLEAARTSTSSFLDQQVVNVLKMSETYGALAKEGKEKQEKERSERGKDMSVTHTIMPTASAPSHTSTMARNSVISSKGMSRATSSGLGLAVGPPRLPLPPSPIRTAVSSSSTASGTSPTGHSSAFGSPTFLPASPPSTAGSTPQAQITSLTYALHNEHNRYESLSAQMVQLRAEHDQERLKYEAKIAALISRDATRERELQDLKDQLTEHSKLRKLQGKQSRHVSYEQHYSRQQQQQQPNQGLAEEEREGYERRLKEFEKQAAKMDAKIVALEEARAEWQKEREGMMWLLGRVGNQPDGEEAAVASSTTGPSDSQKTAIPANDGYAESSNAVGQRPGFKPRVNTPTTPNPAGEMTVPVDVTLDPKEASCAEPMHTSPSRDPDQKPIAPLLNTFTLSQPNASSSRTSLDEQLLQPHKNLHGEAGSRRSLSLRRHSFHVNSPSTTSTGDKRFSAVLNDMLQSLKTNPNVGRAIAHYDSQLHTSSEVPSPYSALASDPTVSAPHSAIVENVPYEMDQADTTNP